MVFLKAKMALKWKTSMPSLPTTTPSRPTLKPSTSMPSLPSRTPSRPSFSMPRFGRRNDEFEEFGDSNEEVEMIHSDSALMLEEDELKTFNGYPLEEDYDPYSNYLHTSGHG